MNIKHLCIPAVLAAGLGLAAPAGAADLKDQSKKAAVTNKTVRVPTSATVQVQPPVAGRTDDKRAETPPPGGPASTLPGIERQPISSAKPDKDQALDSATTGLRGAAPTLGADTSRTAKPGFDQGFGAKAEITQEQADRVRDSNRNPINGGLTGGQVVGGPLGAAAASQAGTPTGKTTDMISSPGSGSGITTPNARFENGEVKTTGKGQLAKELGINEKGVMNTVTGGRFEELDRISRGEDAGGGGAAGGGAAPATGGEGGGCTDCTTKTSSDGRNTVVTDKDGTKHVYVDGKKVGTVAPDGTATPVEKADAGRPDPEGRGRPTNEDLQRRLNDPNFQIIQAAKTGGNINPDRNDNSAIDRSAPLPTTSQVGQGLFGQPTQGLNDSGGGSGTSGFNNKNMGAIDPGRDATFNTTTGPEQNRAEDALNRGPSRPPLQAPASSSDDDEDEDDGSTTTSSGK